MNSKLQGVAEFIFIRGGIAKESNNPYLQVSNGRSELWVTIPKGEGLVNVDTFKEYNEDDTIELEVIVTPGSDAVTLVSVVG